MTTSPAFSRGVQSVVTLHDLNFLQHPQWYSRRFRAVYGVTALPGLRRATVVVAVSNYVKLQAQKRLGLCADRTRCIHNGVKPMAGLPIPVSSENRPYLLTVGSLQPHKNLLRLVKAFLSLSPEFPTLELWVVGRFQQGFSRDRELAQSLTAPGIRMLGYLDERRLAGAYEGASAFCYPSLEEGFGLPVLEAMQAGVPVIAANCSCLPEIAGPAAEMIDPLAVESIASGIRRVLHWPAEERANRVRLGREWVKGFSWRAAAESYLSIYEELLRNELATGA